METQKTPNFPEKKYSFDDEFLVAVCRDVSNGGDVITYVHKNTTRTYSEFIKWIFESNERRTIWKDAQQARLEWFTQRTISELKSLAFVDPNDMYYPDNTLKPINEIPENLRRCISKIEVDEIYDFVNGEKVLIGRTKKVSLWDKKGSLDSFMKHLGMFIDRIAQINGQTDDDAFRNQFFGV